MATSSGGEGKDALGMRALDHETGIVGKRFVGGGGWRHSLTTAEHKGMEQEGGIHAGARGGEMGGDGKSLGVK